MDKETMDLTQSKRCTHPSLTIIVHPEYGGITGQHGEN